MFLNWRKSKKRPSCTTTPTHEIKRMPNRGEMVEPEPSWNASTGMLRAVDSETEALRQVNRSIEDAPPWHGTYTSLLRTVAEGLRALPTKSARRANGA